MTPHVQGVFYSRKFEDTKRVLNTYAVHDKNKKYTSLVNKGYNSTFGKANIAPSFLQGRLNATQIQTNASIMQEKVDNLNITLDLGT